MGLRRPALAVLAAVPTAALLAAVPALGATAFTVSGTRASGDPPGPEQLVPSYFIGDTIDRIDYPAAVLGMDESIAVAAAGIVAGIADTVGPVVVAGFSQGAVATAHVKQQLMALAPEDRPAPELLSFFTVGDPSGPGGIMNTLLGKVPVLDLTPIIPPDTPYRSVVVNGEYDGWADFPDRQWNLVSVVNALLGIVYVHGGYQTIPGGLDLTTVPKANITTTVNSLGGSTTLYLLPTGKLPLVQPLRDIGVPEPIVTAIEKPLKAIVDAGYDRNDVTPPSAATTVRPAVAEPTEDLSALAAAAEPESPPDPVVDSEDRPAPKTVSKADEADTAAPDKADSAARPHRSGRGSAAP